MTLNWRNLSILMIALILAACTFAQDRIEEHYTLTGDGQCDTIITITTEAALDVAVTDSSNVQIAGTNMHAGDVYDVRLPTGVAEYELAVWHEGATWSYDLRVDCPPPAPTDEPAAHNLGEYLESKGVDLTQVNDGVVATMAPTNGRPRP